MLKGRERGKSPHRELPLDPLRSLAESWVLVVRTLRERLRRRKGGADEGAAQGSPKARARSLLERSAAARGERKRSAGGGGGGLARSRLRRFREEQ